LSGLGLSARLLHCLFDRINVFSFEIEILVLFDAKLGQYEVAFNWDICMIEDGLCPTYITTVDSHSAKRRCSDILQSSLIKLFLFPLLKAWVALRTEYLFGIVFKT
jgi:hypothetical protein